MQYSPVKLEVRSWANHSQIYRGFDEDLTHACVLGLTNNHQQIFPIGGFTTMGVNFYWNPDPIVAESQWLKTIQMDIYIYIYRKQMKLKNYAHHGLSSVNPIIIHWNMIVD